MGFTLGDGLTIMSILGFIAAMFYRIVPPRKLNTNNPNNKYNEALCKQSHEEIDRELARMENRKDELAEKVEEDKKELATKADMDKRELTLKIDGNREMIFRKVEGDRVSIEGKVDQTRNELVTILSSIEGKIDGHIKYHAEK
jgi:hypothetical protein